MTKMMYALGEKLDDKKSADAFKELIESAESEITLIDSDLSVMNLPGAWQSVKNVRDRKIPVRIIAIDPPPRTIERLENMGCEVKIGKEKLDPYYLMIDGFPSLECEKSDKTFSSIGSPKKNLGPRSPRHAGKLARLYGDLISDEKMGLARFLGLVGSTFVVAFYTSVWILNMPIVPVAFTLAIASFVASGLLFRQ